MPLLGGLGHVLGLHWFLPCFDRAANGRVLASQDGGVNPINNQSGCWKGCQCPVSVTVFGMADTFQNGDHLFPTDRPWPDPEAGPWVLQFHWQVLNGRAECIGFEFHSALPADEIEKRWPAPFDDDARRLLGGTGSPLRTSTLRSLNLAEVLAEEREKAHQLWAGRIGWDDWAKPFETPKTAMRPATLKKLTRVAEIYKSAWQKGEPPTKAVSKKLGVTEAGASGLVSRARAAGLLPVTSPGVPVASDRSEPSA